MFKVLVIWSQKNQIKANNKKKYAKKVHNEIEIIKNLFLSSLNFLININISAKAEFTNII